LVGSTGLHARLQARVLEVLLRHALGQAFLTDAIGIGGGHIDLELLAGLTAFHRLFQARDDVAVADQDRQRLAAFRGFQRLLALLGNGVVEADDAVILDFHCGTRLVAARGSNKGKGAAGCRQRRERPSSSQ
jgi:hypothetical protein